MMLERVKAEWQQEAEAAARQLGVADIQFWDLGDYPIRLSEAALYRLIDVYRGLSPAFVLTHSSKDIYNQDHPAVSDFAQPARIIAQAHGHNPGQTVLGAPPVFLFESHQPEQCEWQPNVLLDITPVWRKKRAAIQCMAGQEHLWEYYTRVALQRGAQAARNSEKKISCGESVFPHVVEGLA
jgi:4-oxalomesaconate hydratase